jgi:lysophospholipase L1-like esterase
MIGINDIFQGVDVETVEHNIRDIVGQLTAFATTRKVFLQSTLPCNSNLSKACASMLPVIDVLNRYLVQFAQSSEKIQFLDLVPAMSDTDGLLSVDYTYDGTHLTSAAYKIWVMELNRVLEAEAR